MITKAMYGMEVVGGEVHILEYDSIEPCPDYPDGHKTIAIAGELDDARLIVNALHKYFGSRQTVPKSDGIKRRINQ
jgi:hypothetical protein